MARAAAENRPESRNTSKFAAAGNHDPKRKYGLTQHVADGLAMSNENTHHEADRNFERVRRYADGAALIFTNAEALYDEAQLLGQAGHFARATVLHQISMEECSKIDILGAAATSILIGGDVDETRLARAFRNHKSKNHANAFFATTTDEEMAARARGDWKAASEAFKKFQDKFHAEVNTIKNAGLYVDFQDGQFTAPVDEVDEPTAIAFQSVNAYFLKHCDNFLRLLRRMVSGNRGKVCGGQENVLDSQDV